MKWKQRLECLKDNPNPEMKAEAIKLAPALEYMFYRRTTRLRKLYVH